MATRAAKLRKQGGAVWPKAADGALASTFDRLSLFEPGAAIEIAEPRGPFVFFEPAALAIDTEAQIRQFRELERRMAEAPDLRVLVHDPESDRIHAIPATRVRDALAQDVKAAGAEADTSHWPPTADPTP